MTEFYYDPDHDTNDGTEWTHSDIDDLKAELEGGLGAAPNSISEPGVCLPPQLCADLDRWIAGRHGGWPPNQTKRKQISSPIAIENFGSVCCEYPSPQSRHVR